MTVTSHRPAPVRPLRRLAAALIPPQHRAGLRSLYESITAPADRVRGHIGDDADDVCVSMQPPVPSFRVVRDSRASLEDHLRNPRQAAELATFVREAAAPGVLFDVGANDGLFSILFCLCHAANRVVAFEPSWILCDRLHRNARLNGIDSRTVVVAKVVADRHGHLDVVTNSVDGYVQPAVFDGTGGADWQRCSIETTTLDAEAEAVPPSLVKIDVEGYEYEVLLGAGRLLSTVRPVVFLELHLSFLEERRIAPSAVLRLLTQHDYQLFALSGRRLSERDVTRSWGRALHLVARPPSVSHR